MSEVAVEAWSIRRVDNWQKTGLSADEIQYWAFVWRENWKYIPDPEAVIIFSIKPGHGIGFRKSEKLRIEVRTTGGKMTEERFTLGPEAEKPAILLVRGSRLRAKRPPDVLVFHPQLNLGNS